MRTLDEALERDAELAVWLAEAAESEGVQRAEALLAAGHRMLALGRGEEAVAAVATARDLFEEAAVSGPLARCDHNAATVLSTLGRHDEALELHRRAVELHRERFELVEAARCEVHVADTLRAMGRSEDALAQYEADGRSLGGRGRR